MIWGRLKRVKILTNHLIVHSRMTNFLTMLSEYFLTNFIKWQQTRFRCWMLLNLWYSVIMKDKSTRNRILKLDFTKICLTKFWRNWIQRNYAAFGYTFDHEVHQKGIENWIYWLNNITYIEYIIIFSLYHINYMWNVFTTP